MGTTDEILGAARVLFERRGLEGLTLRGVAKRVGITPMAIYRHFDSKQALVDALVLDALAEWSQRAMAIEPAPPVEWLRRIGAAYLDFALHEPRLYEAAFLLHSTKARQYPDDFAAGRSPAGTLQLRLIKELMQQGLLQAGSPLEILTTIAALSQGLITLYRAGRVAGGEAGFREFYSRAMERCVRSFATRPT